MPDSVSQQSKQSQIALAYLVGHYPGVSLTFILREILLLRKLGITIETGSINSADPSRDGFTEVEKQEQSRTFYVKARGAALIASDHVRCFLSRPLLYIRGLRFAAKLAGLDLKALVYHLLYFAEAVVVGEWLLRRKLTHVHVHFANACSTVALIARQIYPIHYSITVHGPTEFYGVEFYHLREKIEGAAFVCCIGQFCRSQLMKISPPSEWRKFRLSPLGVDPAVFSPRTLPSAPEFQILCVGRVVPEKGQAVLLAAVAGMVEEGRKVRLHFVGDGPDRAWLEAETSRLQMNHAVVFHGSMNQLRLKELWAITDVFVLPSFAEGIPVALMEAMAMEIPCISTYIAGIPELIDSGTNGILVPPSDASLLRGALEQLMDDPELRLRLAQNGRQKIVERFNLPRNVELLSTIYQQELSH